MNKTDKAIIKVSRDMVMDNSINPLDYGIKYLSDRINTYDIIDAILELKQDLTEYRILMNYLENKEDEVYNMLLENTNEEDREDFKTIQDFIDYDGARELIDFTVENDEDIRELCISNDCDFDTVGYSDWSYYVSIEDVEHGFANDLWEGYNWYVLQLIEDNDIVDSIGGVYITDTEELDISIGEIYGLDKEEYLIVDNEDAKYFHKDKIREIKHCSYEYAI